MNASIHTTRTGPLISQLITGVQADIGEAVEQLEGGLATIRALEAVTKGVNGLASTLRSKGNEIEQIIDVLRNESDGVPKKMLGTPLEPITEQVDADHRERVRAARAVG
jgi:hypothetical protein